MSPIKILTGHNPISWFCHTSSKNKYCLGNTKNFNFKFCCGKHKFAKNEELTYAKIDAIMHKLNYSNNKH